MRTTLVRLAVTLALSVLLLSWSSAWALLPASVFQFAEVGFSSDEASEGSSGERIALPSLAPMLESTSLSVVNIATYVTVKKYSSPLLSDPFFRRFFNVPDGEAHSMEEHSQSAGSGVVIDAKNGYIVTNSHVIQGASKIKVSLKDGRSFIAELVGQDKAVDLALLRIKAKHLRAINLAESSRLRVGDFAVAIGNPFGLGQTVTSGIISALGRSGLGLEGYEDFIQTDASINPGNSGGALVNLRGELIGINTAIFSPQGGNVGIGFAIPTDIVVSIMKQLVEYGEVRRGVVGVIVQDVTNELAEAMGLENRSGVIINEIIAGSSAEAAGLKTGDVIFDIDGKHVRDKRGIANVLGFKPTGTEIVMNVWRNNKIKEFVLVVAEPKNQNIKGKTLSPYFKGVRLSDKITTDGSHLLFAQLSVSSLMYIKGIRAGDILVAIGDKTVYSVEDLRQHLKKTTLPFSLVIVRDGRQYRLVFR